MFRNLIPINEPLRPGTQRVGQNLVGDIDPPRFDNIADRALLILLIQPHDPIIADDSHVLLVKPLRALRNRGVPLRRHEMRDMRIKLLGRSCMEMNCSAVSIMLPEPPLPKL